MKVKISILPIFLLTLYFGCTKDSVFDPELDLVVIRAYLYANQPVTDVQITGTLSLGSEEASPPPINDAAVWLMKGGQRYDLQSSGGDSGYYHYPGGDLTVNVGDVFEIFVDYLGREATGTTVVPEAPKNVVISGNKLYVPQLASMQDMWNFAFDSTRHQLTMRWEEDPSSLFFVSIENLESNPDSVEVFGRAMMSRMRRFISAPMSFNEYTVRFQTVSYYGQHRIYVYLVNQEYTDLYTSRQQDSRDLNEPLTNIKNGLGVFSAFNSVSFEFQVEKE